MSEIVTIGADHGYAAIKTAHFSFPTGLVEYEHEPYTSKDVLDTAANITSSGADASRFKRTRR